MGVYLGKPVKDKFSANEENSFLKCGASSMQGWRMSQEDAHNCCLDFDGEVSLFAVYDGHGGAEVAEYASKHLPDTIKNSSAYKEGNLEKALKDAFLSFDATLITEPVLEELKKIAGAKEHANNTSETDEDAEEDDVEGLREEARMPIADVIARYANGSIPKTPALRRLKGESSKSPFLHGKVTSDSEVSSSSGSGGAGGNKSAEAEVVTNGICESSPNGGSVSNGEAAVESTSDEATSLKKEDSCDVVSSSSAINGESQSPTTSDSANSARLSAKRARSNMYRSLLAAVAAGAEESDSDDNDESFSAVADTSTAYSSEEEEESGNVEENGDDLEVAQGEDSDDDEEEEEEEVEEEEEDDNPDQEIDLVEGESEEEPGKGSGCTAVVSLVTKDRVIVANAGDSRAILSRKGEAIDLSIDHKPEDPIELNRIVNAGGRITSDGRVNGGLNLSRALGDHMYKKTSKLPATEQMITALPDIKSVELKEGEDEFIVLACDGIWNSMSSQEVVDFVRPLIAKGVTLSEICEKLFDNCLAEHTLGDGTGCDNMTCVIVQLFPHINTCSSKRKSEEASEEDPNKRVKVDADGGET